MREEERAGNERQRFGKAGDEFSVQQALAHTSLTFSQFP